MHEVKNIGMCYQDTKFPVVSCRIQSVKELDIKVTSGLFLENTDGSTFTVFVYAMGYPIDVPTRDYNYIALRGISKEQIKDGAILRKIVH